MRARLLTVSEAAEFCRISPATYRRRAAQGVLPRPNELRRIDMAALQLALDAMSGIVRPSSNQVQPQQRIVEHAEADDAEAALDQWLQQYGEA